MCPRDAAPFDIVPNVCGDWSFAIASKLDRNPSLLCDTYLPVLVLIYPLSFPPSFCLRYPEVDIAALCQFLANALRAADSFDLLVLKDLVETLTGISITSDMSDEQVRAGIAKLFWVTHSADTAALLFVWEVHTCKLGHCRTT